MNLEDTIKHYEEVVKQKETVAKYFFKAQWESDEIAKDYKKCAAEYKQLAEWLKELKVFKSKKGQWLRMSNLSEQEDDRYRCSYCGNVTHHKDKVNLYTFNSWCGRCGSDNGRY